MTQQDLLQLATVGDLQKFAEGIIAAVKMVVEPAIQPPDNDRYLKIKEVEAYTGFKRPTIMNWIKEGKPDRSGKIVKLEYKEFSPGDYRILKSLVDAYGSIGTGTTQPQKSNLKHSRMKLLGQAEGSNQIQNH